MKALVGNLKNVSRIAQRSSNVVEYLDSAWGNPECQRVFHGVRQFTPERLGIDGQNDPYHWRSLYNRVTIDGNEDYRLVLWFIKKGGKFPLHDHPNMSVFFRLLMGKIRYTSFDKCEKRL